MQTAISRKISVTSRLSLFLLSMSAGTRTAYADIAPSPVEVIVDNGVAATIMAGIAISVAVVVSGIIWARNRSRRASDATQTTRSDTVESGETAASDTETGK